jgi:protein-disulfide isomerase-like protein with CxxC motif
LLLRALGLANATVRELVEMQYQFAEPFIVDSTRITQRLGVHATPLELALATTMDSYASTAPNWTRL